MSNDEGVVRTKYQRSGEYWIEYGRKHRGAHYAVVSRYTYTEVRHSNGRPNTNYAQLAFVRIGEAMYEPTAIAAIAKAVAQARAWARKQRNLDRLYRLELEAALLRTELGRASK